MPPFIDEQRLPDTSNLNDDIQHTRNPELDGNDAEPIAIIGFSFKFPDDADTPEGFWDMLLEQRYTARKFPADRVNADGYYRKKNKNNSLPLTGGNFIKDEVGAFDADFFSISPAEAMGLDPMQQKLLEVSYHAFENAGLPIESVANTDTSVYTGSFTFDYLIKTVKDVDDLPTYAGYGAGVTMLANRISHFYNLSGPSIAVDSACSSSAMALDMAVQSLRTRSSSMSLVAGCNLTFGPETFLLLSNMNMLSKDNRSYSFDSRANGYARGEGIAVMIVKRLSDAIRDGNTIRAVIRSTGANEDGRTPGITQPSQAAQERLIRDTYSRAGLSRSLTRYCEAHGTGTPLGDPLESAAIGNCFRDYRSNTEPMYLGSVKSNIGHTEGASGLAGVIKAVFALENGVIPPNADFQEINPRIDTNYLRIRIPTEPTPWPTQGLRRASVNSFGYGGANCHIVLDDAYNYLKLRGLNGIHKTATHPQGTEAQEDEAMDDAPSADASPRLIVLSASDEAGVQRLATSYAPHLLKKVFDGTAHTKYFDSLAYTLDSHRSLLPYRVSLVAESVEDLMELGSTLPKPMKARSSPLHLGFVFTGQGAQWHAMGRELLTYPIYKRSILEADAYLNSLGCPWSALEELNRSGKTTKIDDPEYSQTLCTVVQVALVDLLDHVNIKPIAVVGHSSGEIGAAYSGKYISKQSAWKIAYQRGVVASKLTRSTDHGTGAMMSVGLPEKDALPYISEVLATEKADIGLRVACVNSPTNITIAGDGHLIDALRHLLSDRIPDTFARKLRVQVAYHSPQMQAVANEYLESLGPHLENLATTETIPMFSSVTGRIVTGKELSSPTYWIKNMISPVLFSHAVLEMCGSASAVDCLVEVGPHSALEGPLRGILKSQNARQDIEYSSVLVRNKPANFTLLQVAGSLWCKNHVVNVRAVNELDTPTLSQNMVDLPSYPFDHTYKYWHESRISKAYRFRNPIPHDFLGSRCVDWSPLDARWRLLIRERDLPWVAEHLVDGRKVYPGTGMLVMAIEAAKELADPRRSVSGFAFRDVDFSSAMELEGATEVLEVITSLKPVNGTSKGASMFNFNIISYTDPDWVRNIRGSIEIAYEENDWNATQKRDLLKSFATQSQKGAELCTAPVDESFMYKRLKEWGLDYGPAFRRAKNQFASINDEALADISTFNDDDDDEDLQPHIIHPATFDAIGHLCFTAFSAGGTKSIAAAMPSTIEYAWVSARGLSAPEASFVRTYSKVTTRTPRGFQFDVTAVDPENIDELRLNIKGCTMASISEVSKESGTYKQVELPNPAQQWLRMMRKIDLDMLSWAEVEQILRQHGTEPMVLACKFIELLAHQNPGLQILQVGTCDKAQIQRIFDAALDQERSGSLTCARYDVISSEEEKLGSLKDALAIYEAKMNFYSGYEDREYDLIIALGHERTLEETLDEAKCRLKPGGKVLVHSLVVKDDCMEEKFRQKGFSGTDLVLKATDATSGIVISTAMRQTNGAQGYQQARILITGNFQDQRHVSLANNLKDDKRFEIIQTSLSEAAQHSDLSDSILIILSDPDHMCLESMTQESFSALQAIISTGPKILWVSDKSAETAIQGSPVSSIIEGSARSLRMENNNSHLVTLFLESLEGKSIHHILQVLEKMFSRLAGSNYEQDYFEVDGYLHTDRLMESSRLKDAANTKLAPQYIDTVKLGVLDFGLEISQVAHLDTLGFVEKVVAQEELQADEVDVQVGAVSINSQDYTKAMGKGKSQRPQFGNACAGVVTKASTRGDYTVGDRIFSLEKNSFKSRIRSLGARSLKLPEAIDLADACEAIPALAAAHYALTRVAHWHEGESVLVYPCNGPVGAAAIQVCQQLGATVSTTVFSEEQERELREQFNLDAISVYSHDAFSCGYRPNFDGADVVLCLTPPPSWQNWTFVNKFARIVTITDTIDAWPTPQLPANVIYSVLNFEEVAAERPRLLRDSLDSALAVLTATHGLRRTRNRFPAAQVVEAFRHVADTTGQAVITLDPEDEIALTRKTRSTLHLDPNASYVISGGTGGIGRSMARWCAARGARNLILLSRFGPKTEAARELISSLTDQGVHVEAPPCDTADEKTLRIVLDDCLLHMPPIKGCMQASGAYKDLTFDKYSLDEWNIAIRSKVTSSWNLHRVLPSGMDFFIMLSSVGGILGAISMASYAGANSYQDGLARHRIAMGEKAAAFNPGILHDIGFVTEFSDAQRERLDRIGYFIPTYEAEILALLDIFCDPECPMLNDVDYRPIVGMKSIAQMGADGTEVPFTFTQPLWQHMMYTQASATNKSSTKANEDVKTMVETAESLDEAALVATGALRKHLAVLLSTQEERLQDGAGVDSLIAIELRNWIGKAFGADVPVFEIVGASTWSVLGKSIATQVRE